MTTPADVMARAGEMMSGSRFERARAGASALSAFVQLTPEDKRDLAVLVAQRVAPELVPRIEAETGMDLTQEQSRAVVDMIGRLDGDDIEEVTSALRSPDARRAALGTVGAAAASATGLEDVVADERAGGAGNADGSHDAPVDAGDQQDETAPEPVSQVAAAAAEAVAEHGDDAESAMVATLQSRVADLEGRLAAAEAEVRTVTADRDKARADVDAAEELITELETKLRDAESEAATTRREHDATVDDLRRRLERARRESGGDGRTAPAAPVVADDGPRLGFDTEIAFESPAAVLAASGVEATPAPTPTPTTSVAQLVGDIDGLTGSAALRRIKGLAARLDTTTTRDLASLLQAVPDGWARRRALEVLVAEDVADAADTSLLALLERTSDQVFAAGAFLDAGVDFAAMAPHLSASARSRVERRL